MRKNYLKQKVKEIREQLGFTELELAQLNNWKGDQYVRNIESEKCKTTNLTVEKFVIILRSMKTKDIEILRHINECLFADSGLKVIKKRVPKVS